MSNLENEHSGPQLDYSQSEEAFSETLHRMLEDNTSSTTVEQPSSKDMSPWKESLSSSNASAKLSLLKDGVRGKAASFSSPSRKEALITNNPSRKNSPQVNTGPISPTSKRISIGLSFRSTSPGAVGSLPQPPTGTAALPEMKAVSVKMQPASKKNPPRSLSMAVGSFTYRYKIMPGNNSRVIMAAMKKRPWWHAILGAAGEIEDDSSSSASATAAATDLTSLTMQPTFLWEMIRRAARYRTNQFHGCLLNHIQRNVGLVTKKGLYLSLKQYCAEQRLDLLSIIPLTFYLAPGEMAKAQSMREDDLTAYMTHTDELIAADDHQDRSVWILKPASKTNRGFGIKVVQSREKVLRVVQRGLSAASDAGSVPSAAAKPTVATATAATNSSSKLPPAKGKRNSAAAAALAASAAIAAAEGSDGHVTEVEEDGGEEEEDDDDEDDNIEPPSTHKAIAPNAFDTNPLNKQARQICRTDGYIVQAYLERPLLVRGRKFDIRCFVLVTVLPIGTKYYGSGINSNSASVVTSSQGSSVLRDSADGDSVTQLVEADDSGLSSLTEDTSATAAIHNRSESPGKASSKLAASSISAKITTGSNKATNNKPSRRNSMKGSPNTQSNTKETKAPSSKEKEVRAYFFQEAYIRTSCKKYTLNNFADRETHLTNDAVQKHAAKYGQFEEGNKLSLEEWEGVLLEEYPDRAHVGIVQNKIMPAIRQMSKVSIAAVEQTFKQTDINRSFELFGYDYMIKDDAELSPVLIEVNTNPCLEFVCPLLTRIISEVIDHSIRVAVDPICPPPPRSLRTKTSEEAVQALQGTPCKFDPLFP